MHDYDLITFQRPHLPGTITQGTRATKYEFGGDRDIQSTEQVKSLVSQSLHTMLQILHGHIAIFQIPSVGIPFFMGFSCCFHLASRSTDGLTFRLSLFSTENRFVRCLI